MPRENLLLLLPCPRLPSKRERFETKIAEAARHWRLEAERNESKFENRRGRWIYVTRHPSSCHLTLQFEGNPRRWSSNSEAGHRLPLRNEISICRNELMHHEFAPVSSSPTNCILPLKEPAFDPLFRFSIDSRYAVLTCIA